MYYKKLCYTHVGDRMKVLFISDIHGNIEYLNRALERYRNEEAEKLLILGDFGGYVHSSADYEVAEELNNMAGAIIAVKGNCDSEYIDDIFNFSLTYMRTIEINNKKVTLTHGHIYGPYNLPSDCGDVFLFGHTHRGMIEKLGEKIIANPGSISKPRGGTKKSYIAIDENNIELKTLDGETIKKLNVKY